MASKIKLFLILILFLFITFHPSRAQAESEQYLKGSVVKIVSEGEIINNGQKNLYQDIEVKTQAGKVLNIHLGDPQTLTLANKVQKDDQIVIIETKNLQSKTIYQVYDKYRINNILLIFVLFAILVIAIAGLKGIGSMVGLTISLCIILFFIIPQILNGNDPLMISVLGSLVILFVSTYVAHGISRQTSVALISTFCALFITAVIAIVFTSISKLTGVGDEDIASLQIGTTSIINLKGLFLAGVIIGTLGALNDVTITQAATVFELAKTNRNLFKLFGQGFSVGREHILSLVNTLVLAYAGSSLFIFIFIVLNPAKIPYWVILNTETISGEVVSTIAGSAGLILAVPIATLLASWVSINLNKN